MHAAEIRRAVEAAPRVKLPEVAALLWRAYGEGHVTDAEAEELHAVIEARGSMPRSPVLAADHLLKSQPIPQTAQDRPRGRAGSRPRTDASMERRRRWAASGRLPPAIAARFTLAEQAVLALVAAETCRRRDCRLAVPHLAALAGVSETTVRNAIREASRLGLVTVEARRVAGWRNDTNVVRIVSPEWQAWLRLAKGRPAWPSPASGEGANPRTARLLRFQSWGNRARRSPHDKPESPDPAGVASCRREARPLVLR